jgi:hypothetical protein
VCAAAPLCTGGVAGHVLYRSELLRVIVISWSPLPRTPSLAHAAMPPCRRFLVRLTSALGRVYSESMFSTGGTCAPRAGTAVRDGA